MTFVLSITIYGVVVIFVIVLCILLYGEGNLNYWKNRGIHEIYKNDVIPLLDHFLLRLPVHEIEFRVYKALRRVSHGAEKIGGTVLFRHPLLYLLDLDLIQQILTKDWESFANRRHVAKPDRQFDSILFNITGEKWKSVRIPLTYIFTTNNMKEIFSTCQPTVKSMIDYLNEKVTSSPNTEIEFRSICKLFVCNYSTMAICGVDVKCFLTKNNQNPFVVQARKTTPIFNNAVRFKVFINYLFPRLSRALHVSFFGRSIFKIFEDLVITEIHRKRELSPTIKASHGHDFLQIIMMNNQLKSETSENQKNYYFSDSEIVTQFRSFFFGGTDTLETALSWAVYELTVNPDIQERLYDELQKVTPGGLEIYAEIQNLEYLDMVVSEVLRKYPPSGRTDRICNRNYKVPGMDFVIEKGTNVLVPIFSIHRDPLIYPDPDRFDPERFSFINRTIRHPFAYLPFGFGPRMCLANRFSIIQIKVMLANLILQFKLNVTQKMKIPMPFSRIGVLKPESDIPILLEKRDINNF